MSTLVIEGRELPLREHVSAKGNTSFVVSPKNRSTGAGFRGTGIPAMSEALPNHVEFAGVTIPMQPGVTGSGNVKVSGSATVEVNGHTLTASVLVSQPSADKWHLIAKAIPQGGGASAVSSLDEF